MKYQYKREPLREDEELRLRASAQTSRERLAVILPLETGIRVSELAELQLDNIDWQKRRLIVYGKGGDEHNSKRRILPLSDEAFEVISRNMALLDQQNRKQTKTAGDCWCTPRTLNRLIKRVANRARITRKCSPHVLRHTFAMACRDKGIDLRTLQELLGHESLQTTEIYLNLSPDKVCSEFMAKWKKKKD